ncbi:MAG: thiamine pyrophosphate-dependent enzyme [Atopobiaceae bacterium]|nr:thiamine pyrophosphate-dependent enzyme [Atopobiaceae bacterium]MCH4230370.1 thiamine pyrophosphate-dependent enzyme [Atopobiaceae bacterium]MCH4276775.1 thiamine pyrophosphate-dependent enzyme [Atopobiaceae bacterium]MCI1260217.1 thiamine pyrophosphate-dependent enzyme [Atopobiaceae bacterium]MDD2588630.1 thiamine pyrophosphate-dependent enzyme [Atopobiaceae bacterium]
MPSAPTMPDLSASASRGDAAVRRDLELRALGIRRGVVGFAHSDPAHPFHVGGSLSAADVLAALYGSVMHTGVDGTAWRDRDRFVLSKAHAALALYIALSQVGLLSEDDLSAGLTGPDAVLFRHPRRDVDRGIETSGGSLGMGLGYAAGLALANRRRHLPGRVFCMVGDGECNEGSIWESAAFVGHNALDGLTLIVDANGLQLDGPCAEILDTGTLADRLSAFGFETSDVDGHDVMAVRDALLPRTSRPRAVICHTVKGRGLSFVENRVEWHDHALTDEQYRVACAELDDAEEAIRDAAAV